MAVASGALRHEMEAFIASLGLNGVFRAIVAADDVKKSKPDPETYLLAIERLRPVAGVEAPRPDELHCNRRYTRRASVRPNRRGLLVIAVTNSFSSNELTEADKVIGSLSELSFRKWSICLNGGARCNNETIERFFLTSGFLSPCTVWGQAARAELPQPLGKDAAVEYALAHNRAYRAAFEDVWWPVKRSHQALADFFPKVDASYAYTQLNDQPFVTLTLPGPPATTFSKIPFSIQTINRWEVDLVQPLFTGFGLESQYKASKVGLKISKYQLEQARLDLARDVQVAYLQTLLGAKLLEVAHDNVASLEVQKKNAEAGYQQGVAARNDVLKADVALAEAVQRERNAFKQLIILRSNLNQLMDVDLQEKVDLSGIQEKTYKVPDLINCIRRRRRKGPNTLQYRTSIRQAQYSKTAARSRYYPRVSAFAQFYREGEDFSGDNNPYTNNENASVGVRVDWNLFEGGKTRSSELEWEYRLRGIEKRQRRSSPEDPASSEKRFGGVEGSESKYRHCQGRCQTSRRKRPDHHSCSIRSRLRFSLRF